MSTLIWSLNFKFYFESTFYFSHFVPFVQWNIHSCFHIYILCYSDLCAKCHYLCFSFWQDMCFNITRYDLQRHNYFSVACGHLVRNAIVKYNSLSDVCVYEVASLLQRMTKNLNIRSLMFEPSHCHMFLPPRNKMFLER